MYLDATESKHHSPRGIADIGAHGQHLHHTEPGQHLARHDQFSAISQVDCAEDVVSHVPEERRRVTPVLVRMHHTYIVRLST